MTIAAQYKKTNCLLLDLCREELQLLREEADKKISELEGRCQDLQSVIQQVSEDFQKVRPEHTWLRLHFATPFIQWLLAFCFSVSEYGDSVREVPAWFTGRTWQPEATTTKGQNIKVAQFINHEDILQPKVKKISVPRWYKIKCKPGMNVFFASKFKFENC